MLFFFFLLSRGCYLFFFFFSSRRRHTRLTCDWSSDVCSSDLGRHASSRPDQKAGRPRTSGSSLRGTKIPVPGCARSSPSSTTTAPRRIVVVGQPRTFQPSQGL